MAVTIEARWAQLKDDVVQFNGHVVSAPRRWFPGPPDPRVIGRVRYKEGAGGPVVWIDSRLGLEQQLWVLEAAWQMMMAGISEAGRVPESGGYWHANIGWSD
jgi:hypothetical protein